eukprot:CAMPEP_0203810020 /NCGR_PEP_ID=MMETSP0115-20131106/2683_1 /ASSEMBLY_ACC=CAM_ASM_000227 /TAXON_ID=33651 /ORGANISM="Bicosoecid sp, Strain ms1" /LENGTH=306 /DNA_ID=CAMNT_0050718791 /DNA_START=52 /DNA_END=972 /DNA_ORIENTATION=+
MTMAAARSGASGWLATIAVATAVLAVVAGAPGVEGKPQTLPRPQSDLVAASLGGAPIAFELTQTSTLNADGTTWTSVFSGVDVRAAGAATVGDAVYIIGGGEQLGNNTVSVWNGKTLAAGPVMPSPRGQLGVAAVDDVIYAIGGYAAKGWDIVESFDTTAQKWTQALPALPTPRYGLSCEAIGTQIYCIGGIAYHTPSVNTVEAFDTAAGRWAPMASLNTARAYFASAVADGKIYVLGGDDGTNKLTSVEVYSPSANSWTAAAAIPNPARSHFAAVTYSAGVLLLGGSVDKGLYEHDIDNADVYAV